MNKPPLDSCTYLINHNFSLIPITDNKMPVIKWKQYQEKAMSESEFENFYNLPKTVDVGIVAGYMGLEVIDIDTKVLTTAQEKRTFWKDFYSLLKDNIEGFESKFVIVKTRSGGYHIIYRTANPDGNKKIATLKGYTEALIESRGVGGYVLMYTDFIQGKNYNDIQIISDSDKEILWSCCKIFNHIEEDKVQYEPIKKTNPVPENGISTAEDFNEKNSCWDLIRDEFTIVKKTTERLIIRRHGATSPHSGYIYNSGLMYLFSTGTQYPHQKALSPFAIYTIQKHNGDFKAAAKDLYKQGYGSRYRNAAKKKKITVDQPELITEKIDFPIEVFPENIQAYILDVHNTLNASIDYLGSAFLWVVSLCVGNAIKIKVKTGWKESAVVWIAIVGKAGVGKTHNIEAITRPLKKLNEREIELYNRQLEKYKDYQAMDAREKKNADEVKEPKKRQFVVGDITMEAFIDYHAANPNGLGILRDELSGWIKDLNKYRDGSDLENYLSGWSGQMLNLTRKTSRSGYVSNAFVPILGGVQPSVLSEIFTPENKDNGFNDRWLICYPDLKVERYNDKEMREEVITWYDEFVIGFYEEIRSRVIKYDDGNNVIPLYIRMEQDAYKEWERIFNKITDIENSDDENEYMKSILPKQKSYIVRFALLLSVLDNYSNMQDYKKISKKSLLDAEKLSDYFIMMARKNKIDSLETQELNKNIKELKGSPEEKFAEMYAQNDNINRTKVAEMFNVSPRTVFRWIKNLEEQNKK